ncbi:MAG: dTDP-4-dehydrorhamnose 3,5-epimerase family protein, partial [Acidobacteriaceae bacterium]
GGRILDVCLDLRLGSPAYGQYWVTEISGDQNKAVYMPSGIAHGFYVLEPPALTVYHVTTEHNSSLDTGIAWDSFGMQWPAKMPLISSRDGEWPKFRDFKSPFRYQPGRKVGREVVRP